MLALGVLIVYEGVHPLVDPPDTPGVPLLTVALVTSGRTA